MSFVTLYISEYNTIAGDVIRIEIAKFNAATTATPQVIDATAKWNAGSARDFNPIREKRCELTLEANLELDFFDLLPRFEHEVKVEVYRNGAVEFKGFLIAEGFLQDYVRTRWQPTLIAVDGLSLLSNLAYVDENKNNHVGTATLVEVMRNALRRTGLTMDIYIPTNNNSVFTGDNNPRYHTDEQQGFSNSFWTSRINQEVFIAGDEAMTCEEVITELLRLSGHFICQENGVWKLGRPLNISRARFKTNAMLYQRYTDGVRNGEVEENMYYEVGEQTNGYPLFWVNENQRLEGQQSLGANRATYNFGDTFPLIANVDLVNDGTTIAGWTIIETDPARFEIFNNTAIKLTRPANTIDPRSAMQALLQDIIVGDVLIITSSHFISTVRTGMQWLIKLTNTESTTDYWFSSDTNMWETTEKLYEEPATRITNQQINSTITTTGFPESGDIELVLNLPYVNRFGFPPVFAEGVVVIDSIGTSLVSSSAAIGLDVLVQRETNPSSVVQAKQDFFISDSVVTDLEYIGTLLNSADEPIITGNWFNELTNSGEGIMQRYLEDIMILKGATSFSMSGDVKGYVPYLSKIHVAGLNKDFNVIGYSYDSVADVTNLDMVELFADPTVYPDLLIDSKIIFEETNNATVS